MTQVVISWPDYFISFYVDKVSSGLKLNAPKIGYKLSGFSYQRCY